MEDIRTVNNKSGLAIITNGRIEVDDVDQTFAPDFLVKNYKLTDGIVVPYIIINGEYIFDTSGLEKKVFNDIELKVVSSFLNNKNETCFRLRVIGDNIDLKDYYVIKTSNLKFSIKKNQIILCDIEGGYCTNIRPKNTGYLAYTVVGNNILAAKVVYLDENIEVFPVVKDNTQLSLTHRKDFIDQKGCKVIISGKANISKIKV